jgi:hypothetical protein
MDLRAPLSNACLEDFSFQSISHFRYQSMRQPNSISPTGSHEPAPKSWQPNGLTHKVAGSDNGKKCVAAFANDAKTFGRAFHPLPADSPCLPFFCLHLPVDFEMQSGE